MSLKFTILGCGNSTGIPAIGNYWGQCDPKDPKNRRTRSSLLVQSATTTLVIDTGPDFRNQINATSASHIDAVLYSHAHSDHVAGIDDLRVIRHRGQKRVDIYGDKATLDDMKQRFHYLFAGGKVDIYPPIVEPHEITPAQFGKPQTVGDIEFIPLEQDHGTCKTVGYRFGDFAYSVDVLDLDSVAVASLKGIKTWVVDGAGYHNKENTVHANLETIYNLNKDIGAQQVYLTSLTLAMDYQTLLDELPDGYAPAYDGLVL